MAEYLALIYESEQAWEQASPQQVDEILTAHQRFGAKHAASLRGGQALQPTSTATAIRTDGSATVSVTDGPFGETKEALGGYYLIDAADLDEAIRIARDVPAPFGGVELRPIRTFG